MKETGLDNRRLELVFCDSQQGLTVMGSVKKVAFGAAFLFVLGILIWQAMTAAGNGHCNGALFSCPSARNTERSQLVGRRAKAWCANPRPGTSFTYKQRTGPHEYKENSCQL
jgi:hypothetical protein